MVVTMWTSTQSPADEAEFLSRLEQDGFARAPWTASDALLEELCEEIRTTTSAEGARQRGGSTYALRNALALLPTASTLAVEGPLGALATAALGPLAHPVKGILFDKTPEANWNVPWHQDLTIAVRRRHEVEGFGPWTVKAGVPHVQPPAEVLEGVLALRLHLDDCGPEDGALRVLPGSHTLGRLDGQKMAAVAAERREVVVTARRGDVLAMRPLLLHKSSPAVQPRHRRVLHLEFAAGLLPGGLEWAVEASAP